MRRKVAALLLGLVFAGLLLKLLDPYAPENGIRRKKKTRSSPELTQFLEQIGQKSPWDQYLIPTYERDNTLIGVEQRFDLSLADNRYMYMSPNWRGIHELRVRRKIDPDFVRIFSAPFSTDARSRRRTLNSPQVPSASIVFLGCSFTWGSGVGDHETFSSIIAREEPRVHVYNLGMRGAGPNDIIDDIEEHPVRFEDIKTEKGIVIYNFIADHIERALCRTSCYSDRSNEFFPNRMTKSRYVLENGELKRNGIFLDESAFSREIKKYIFRSRIANALYYGWTQELFPEDLTIIAKMLERIMIESQKKTGYKFYVAFFPDMEFARHEELKALLDKLSIPYFDYSDVQFNESLGKRGFFAVDGHPSKLGHEAYAQLLLRELRSKERELFSVSSESSTARASGIYRSTTIH